MLAHLVLPLRFVDLSAPAQAANGNDSNVGPIVAVIFLVAIAGAIGGYLVWRYTQRPDFGEPEQPPPAEPQTQAAVAPTVPDQPPTTEPVPTVDALAPPPPPPPAPPVETEADVGPTPPPGATDLRFDATRQAWLAYDRADERWLWHDDETGQWREIDT